jgi:hypothetical protein
VLHQLPLHQIESIRFTGGFTMLADEQPASTSLTPYLKIGVDEMLLNDFFGPAGDGDADLLMFGGSSIEYRIEEGYRVFAGTACRHQNVTRAGSVTVRIAFDGKMVWEQQLADGQPRGFELPLGRARRLSIEIDSDDDGDLGDKVRISRPRLLK